MQFLLTGLVVIAEENCPGQEMLETFLFRDQETTIVFIILEPIISVGTSTWVKGWYPTSVLLPPEKICLPWGWGGVLLLRLRKSELCCKPLLLLKDPGPGAVRVSLGTVTVPSSSREPSWSTPPVWPFQKVQRFRHRGPVWDRSYFSTCSLVGEQERCRHFCKTLVKSGRCASFSWVNFLSYFHVFSTWILMMLRKNKIKKEKKEEKNQTLFLIHIHVDEFEFSFFFWLWDCSQQVMRWRSACYLVLFYLSCQ